VKSGLDQHNLDFGDKVLKQADRPIQRGMITNWDQIENIWHRIFYKELLVEPRDYAVLLAESPSNLRENREKIAEIMFEKFGVNGVHLANSAVLSLYASGRINGVVLESGDGASHAVPIFESRVLPHATLPIQFAGQDMTEHLAKILAKRGVSIEKNIARRIKEEVCFIVLDSEKEVLTPALTREYALPDGEIIKLGAERFLCPESLFKPILNSSEGVHQKLFDSIMKCGIDVHEQMFGNIICSGGNTMFPGIAERIGSEIKSLAVGSAKIKVIASPERIKMTWLGGSIMASLSTFKQQMVSKHEYDDIGPSVVHRKTVSV
jgi:actin-related protein